MLKALLLLLSLCLYCVGAQATSTNKVVLNSTTWTDVGAGPALLSGSGHVVFAIGDVAPTLPMGQGFALLLNKSQRVNTSSHIWAMASDLYPASVYVSPIFVGGEFGAGSMTAPLLWFSTIAPSTTASYYTAPIGGGFNANLQYRQLPSPIRAKIANLAVSLPTAVVVGYYTISLNVNGVSTPLQCSVGQGGVNLGTTTTCSDAVDQVIVNAGDLLALQSTPTGSPTAQFATGTTIAVTSTSTSSQESIVGNGPNNFTSAIAIQYAGLSSFGPSATDALISSIMPGGGTLDRLYMQTTSFVNNSGASVQGTIIKNGIPTPIVATCNGIVSGQQICDDLIDGVNVAAGDTISLQICPSGIAGCQAGVAIVNTTVTFSLRFKPSVANRAVLFSVPNNLPPSAIGNKFGALAVTSNLNSATENNWQNSAPVLATTMTLGNLTIAQCPGPDTTGAGGVTRTFTVRMNGVSQAPTVAIPGNSTAACPTLAVGQDTTHTVQATTGALLDVMSSVNTATNSSTMGELKYSMTATVP